MAWMTSLADRHVYEEQQAGHGIAMQNLCAILTYFWVSKDFMFASTAEH